MMTITRFLLMTVLTLLALPLCSADKLAVAEPVAKSGIKSSDIEALWGILETSVQSDEYKLISRSALKQMLTEIGLTDSSGLVNLNSNQKAQLGKLEGVKYILVTEVAKFGSKINCNLRILDASTGEIDQARTANLRVSNMDELADKIEFTMEKLLSDDKKLNMSAIITPNLRITPVADYLAEDFNIRLESGLLNNNVPLHNLKAAQKILAANKLGKLDEMEPKTFKRVGDLLEVKNLIQATITRFELAKIPYHVAETGASGVRYNGYLEGHVRVISCSRGNVVASVPFEGQVDFRALPKSETRNWTDKDYGKYLIRVVMEQRILPALLKVPELQAKVKK